MKEVKITIKEQTYEGNLPDYIIIGKCNQYTMHKIEHDKEKAEESAKQMREYLLKLDEPIKPKEK